MNPDPPATPEPEDDADRRLLSDVKEFGCHIIAVAEDDEGPSFAYSVGFPTTYQTPEVIIFGLDVKLMQDIINTIGQTLRSGKPIHAFLECDGILVGQTVAFATVAARHYREYVGYAGWYHQSLNFELLQCFWPDQEGRFPWDPACHEFVRSHQPILCDDL